MGNKLLIALLSGSLAYAIGFSDIDALVEKVKEPRKGLDKAAIARLKNPFMSEKKLIKLMKKKKVVVYKKRRRSLRLYSIFNNKANINGRWYHLGSRVGSYRLVAIEDNHIVLRNRYRNLKLFLPKRKRKLIQIENWR